MKSPPRMRAREWITSRALSPDGRTRADPARGGIELRDIETGQILTTLVGKSGVVQSVAFSPDGATLASGTGIGAVNLWDVATERNIATLDGHTSWVWSVVFSPDGKTLASGSRDGTVKLWDVATGNATTLKAHLAGNRLGFLFDRWHDPCVRVMDREVRTMGCRFGKSYRHP